MANITASKTKNIYAPASSSYYYILEASFEETGVSTSNNTSTLSVTAKLTSHYINFGSGGGTLSIYWFDNNENDEGTLVSTKNVSSIALNKSVSTSDTITVNHKSNGTLSGYAKAVWTKTSGNTYTPASNNVQTNDTALTSIAVAPVVTQTITSIQETSIGVRVSANTSIRKTQYCINANSGSPTYFNITGNQSLFTITGLTANTTYYVRARVQGPDSDEYGYSNIVQLTTAQYPYLESISVNNLKAGNSQTVSLKNPLNRECIIYMKKDNTTGTILNSYTTTSNGNVSFTPNATTLANSLPSSDEGNCVYYCYYSSNPNGYVSGKLYSGKFSLDNSQGIYNPTFDESNWSYSSTNYSSLTNDPTAIIKGKSQIDFSVDTAATPATGTSISKYKIEWGTLSDYINSSTTGIGSLLGGTENTIKVTAIDSRGNTTISQKNINLIDYFVPYMSSADTEREDGIGTDTVLNLSGNFFNDTFGTLGVQNALASAKYYVSTDNETWSQGYTIPVNSFVVSNNVFTLNNYSIHANGSSDGFPIGTKYYLKVEITDSLSTLTETNIQVTDGKIAVDCFQDSNGDYHRAINGLADSNYTQVIYGDEYISNNIYAHNNIKADKSLQIPKTGNAGYGLTNSDGSSIIRDFGNTNVTVDATGGSLFLGYNNTSNVYMKVVNYQPTTWDNCDIYPIGVVQGADGINQIVKNKNIQFCPFSGTASQDGTMWLLLGNGIDSGNNDNASGRIRLYSQSTGRVDLIPPNTSANLNITFPKHSGNVQSVTNLYNNTSGTTGNITLNESAGNFDKLIVYYRNNDYNYSSTEIYAPQGKDMYLIAGSHNSTYLWLKAVIYHINGTSFNVIVNAASARIGNAVNTTYSYSNDMYILRIDGIRL